MESKEKRRERERRIWTLVFLGGRRMRIFSVIRRRSAQHGFSFLNDTQHAQDTAAVYLRKRTSTNDTALNYFEKWRQTAAPVPGKKKKKRNLSMYRVIDPRRRRQLIENPLQTCLAIFHCVSHYTILSQGRGKFFFSFIIYILTIETQSLSSDLTGPWNAHVSEFSCILWKKCRIRKRKWESNFALGLRGVCLGEKKYRTGRFPPLIALMFFLEEEEEKK